MINNPYRARPEQAERFRFGEPSWVAALRYRLYRFFHRGYYAAYERVYHD